MKKRAGLYRFPERSILRVSPSHWPGDVNQVQCGAESRCNVCDKVVGSLCTRYWRTGRSLIGNMLCYLPWGPAGIQAGALDAGAKKIEGMIGRWIGRPDHVGWCQQLQPTNFQHTPSTRSHISLQWETVRYSVFAYSEASLTFLEVAIKVEICLYGVLVFRDPGQPPKR